MEKSFVCDAIVAPARGPKTLDELHDLAPVLYLVESAFDACHRDSLLNEVWDLRGEATQVSGENGLVLTEVPLPFARLRAANVDAAAELVAVRHLSVRANFDALCESAVGSILRHW